MPSSGSRTVLLAFAAAVAAALAAVAWLVLSGGPAPEAKVGEAPPAAGAPPVRPPVEPDRKPPRTPPRVEKVHNILFELAGIVLGPDGAPVPDAEVTVLGAVREATPQPPAEGAPEAERVDPETLRECFALTTEEARSAVWYTGVPSVPGPDAEPREVSRASSGPDGKFLVKLKYRGPFRLEARREGVGHAVAGDAYAGGDPVVLKLGPAAPFPGRVLNAAGNAPVPGAVILVRSGRLSRSAVSGADGTFTIPDLPPGRYTLTAGAAGLAPALLPAVEAPPAAPVDVLLGTGFSVRLTVTRREGPRPGERHVPAGAAPQGPAVEGALVVLYNTQTGAYRSAVTGQDGTARVDRLGAGIWRIAARKEGFCVGLGRDVRFAAGGGPEESREVRLVPLVETPVRVIGEDGAPLRNAKVFTGGEDEEYDEQSSRLIGRTDDEGVLRIPFDDSIPWKAVAWIVPEAGGAVVKVEPDEPGSEQKVVARQGREVRGTVKDQNGKPLKGVQVLVQVQDDELDVDIGLYAYSDAAGNWRFPPVPWGETTIEVDPENGEWDSFDVEPENRDNPLVHDFTVKIDEE